MIWFIVVPLLLMAVTGGVYFAMRRDGDNVLKQLGASVILELMSTMLAAQAFLIFVVILISIFTEYSA